MAIVVFTLAAFVGRIFGALFRSSWFALFHQCVQTLSIRIRKITFRFSLRAKFKPTPNKILKYWLISYFFKIYGRVNHVRLFWLGKKSAWIIRSELCRIFANKSKCQRTKFTAYHRRISEIFWNVLNYCVFIPLWIGSRAILTIRHVDFAMNNSNFDVATKNRLSDKLIQIEAINKFDNRNVDQMSKIINQTSKCYKVYLTICGQCNMAVTLFVSKVSFLFRPSWLALVLITPGDASQSFCYIFSWFTYRLNMFYQSNIDRIQCLKKKKLIWGRECADSYKYGVWMAWPIIPFGCETTGSHSTNVVARTFKFIGAVQQWWHFLDWRL